MKFSLTLFLAIALTLSPFAGHGPGCVSCLSWVWNWDQKLDVPEEQHPVGTESQTSTWLCWLGLTPCPDRTEGRKNNQLLPEEQNPVRTESQTSTWLCWLGLTSCPDRAAATKTNQGPKQQSPGTKQKAYSLPGIVGHLWDNLVQRTTWLLTDTLIAICILGLQSIASSLWRRLRRPRAQALPAPNEDQIQHLSGQNACTSQKSELACFYPRLASKSETGKTGLINLGNTCYMNSVIQSLFMASDFRHSVLNLTEGISQPLMAELQWPFALLEHSQRPAISPESFLSASRPPWFTFGAQQDCSEYLKYLLNRLHEEEKTGKRIYQTLKESRLTSEATEHHSLNKTLIEKMFGGKIMTRIRCLKCLNISSKEEAFTDLSLAFPPPDRPVRRPGSTCVLPAAEISPQFIEHCRNPSQPTGSPWVRRKPPVPGDPAAQPVPVETLGFWEPRESAHPLSNSAVSVDTTKDPHLAFAEQTCAPKDSRSVLDLINYFLSPERLTAENQYHCEQCASLQDAEKVAQLTEGPHYLILTLLRFSFDPHTMKRTKILDNVSIPAVLELPILVSSEETEDVCRHGEDRADLGSTFASAVYDLCSVVVHSGISSESGHYYCYSRECTDTVPHAPPRDGTPKPASDKQLDFEIPWYLFNDHRVSTFSFESASNLASLYPKDTAYVLFYRQREGSL
uniref:Ubiquitin carboxyl-terminal hydrolase n=1 Tax=Meleagris gallopavo TaxID=9103 RepID=A0A803Y326_MELGA